MKIGKTPPCFAHNGNLWSCTKNCTDYSSYDPEEPDCVRCIKGRQPRIYMGMPNPLILSRYKK